MNPTAHRRPTDITADLENEPDGWSLTVHAPSAANGVTHEPVAFLGRHDLAAIIRPRPAAR